MKNELIENKGLANSALKLYHNTYMEEFENLPKLQIHRMDNSNEKLRWLRSDLKEDIRFAFLKIYYMEFLQYLCNNEIIIKNSGDTFEFLSYLDSYVNDEEQCILEQIYSSANLINGCGQLQKTGYKYCIGEKLFDEYVCFFKKGNAVFKSETFVRIILKGKGRWISVKPLKWYVRGGCIYSNTPVIINRSFLIKKNYYATEGTEKCEKYISNYLYKELLFHPEQFLSTSLKDQIKLSYKLKKNYITPTNYFEKNKINKLKR